MLARAEHRDRMWPLRSATLQVAQCNKFLVTAGDCVRACAREVNRGWWMANKEVSYVIKVEKSKMMRRKWHVACMKDIRIDYKVIIRKSDGKGQFDRTRSTWGSVINLEFKRRIFAFRPKWLALNRDQLRESHPSDIWRSYGGIKFTELWDRMPCSSVDRYHLTSCSLDGNQS
jgi:hypothetical protein